MAKVSAHIEDLVCRQIDNHGIVVWYDPEKHYASLLHDLDLPETMVEAYNGSFYELRHRVEPLLSDQAPPRLLVYVPLERGDTHHALAELEAAGVVMQPGQQPPTRNTRLPVVARNAAKEKAEWSEEQAQRLESDIEDSKYGSVAEIEEVIERGGPDWGALQVVFGTDRREEMALQFLCDEDVDERIREKGLEEDLCALLNSEFGADLNDKDSLDDVRDGLALRILFTDFVMALGGETPEELTSVPVPEKQQFREACAGLAHRWRKQQDLHQSYVDHADRVSGRLSISSLSVGWEQLTDAETFRAVEEKLQQSVEEALMDEAEERLVELAEEWLSGFWPSVIPEIQTRWALIGAAGKLLLAADKVESTLDNPPESMWGYAEAYTQGEDRWSLLDTYHRHMESRAYRFDFGLTGRHENLQQLLAKCRNRYVEVGGRLAQHFQDCLSEKGFSAEGVLSQREVFAETVWGELGETKTAYVLVDALRYEMAQELVDGLGERFQPDLRPAMGSLPGITEIGMAALMPGADGEVAVVEGKGGKLGLRIGEEVLETRQDRMEWIEKRAGVKVHTLHTSDLFPTPSRKTQKRVKEADLMVVTSQDIDDLCEGKNVMLARDVMDTLLQNLRRALTVLADLGVERIIITADHGYLFLHELSSDTKIDPPGGETADLHRRVWVGTGGSDEAGFMRAHLSELGLGGGLEIAFPRGFGVFKVPGGGMRYFHGGLSLEETVIPVAVVGVEQIKVGPAGSEIKWKVTMGSPKVTTRFVSVQLEGTRSGMFAVPVCVRVEMRCGKEVVSRPVSASYGFQQGTGEVQLRWDKEKKKALDANTVTLMLREEALEGKEVSLHLLDADSGRELKRIENIPVDIAL